MSLSRYRKLRDFAATLEPSGTAESKAGHRYVIQKHAASHLHYDFRLELNGVLLSWAVPKGPTFDPSVKRLAVQTEDHPLEYADFEGTIPEGAYGGGTVMVWDRGSWEAEGEAEQSYRAGRLSFQLHGEKLKGRWHLVRTARSAEQQKSWLLFKANDEWARAGDTGLLEQDDVSALSGRHMPEIAAASSVRGARKKATRPGRKAAISGVSAESTRSASRARKPSAPAHGSRAAPKGSVARKAASSKQGPRAKGRPVRGTASSAARAHDASPPGSARAPMPRDVQVELATLVSEPPAGDDFIHEVKFDGYRVLSRVSGGEARLLTRGGEDWTARMPTLARALQALTVQTAIFDGEFVALDERGVTDFQLLQNSFSKKSSAPCAYYAFDLLYLNGIDLRQASLLDRKACLKQLLEDHPKLASDLRYSDHVVGQGSEFLERAKELGLEGIVSKRADAPYRSGRGKDWQKSKVGARQEFVIVGYTEPSGARAHFGALLLAVHENGKLVYSGRVGTGFDERSLKAVKGLLAPLASAQTELENPPRGAQVRGVHWVRPELVAEVAYAGFTQDRLLRHPTFKGLREDKSTSEVVLEKPVTTRVARGALRAREPQASAPSALSHPDKVLYPELGLTKRELAEYYELVQDLMLPHVLNRPLTLLRCPEGRAKSCFFQKHPGKSLAPGLYRVSVKSAEGDAEYAAIEDARGLRAMVQMGVLEVHIWGALASDSERPDRLVFDLDPDADLKFTAVMAGARAVHDLLEELGLKSWVKTTGGKGLHVTVPIVPEHDWDAIKAFCQGVAQELTRRAPERYVATMSKAKRQGKIFIDYLRNGRGATFVAPYSPRAREGAGIAMPVEWADLSARFSPDAFTIRSARARLAARQADPFAALLECQQRLPSL